MFKFLRDKLKSTLHKFSKKVETKADEIKPEIPVIIKESAIKIPEEIRPLKPEQPKTGERISSLKPEQQKFEKISEVQKTKVPETAPPPSSTQKTELKLQIKPEEKKSEEKGFFQKIKEKVITTTINENEFEKLFEELELALLENNVAVEIIEKIQQDLKKDIVNTPIRRGQVEQVILNSLKETVDSVLSFPKINMLEQIQKKKPYVIVFLGINGSGKTTTIAKMTKYFRDNKLSVVIAAADTYRAAAIDQLQHHADKLNVKLIKHNYGSDPAAVAFDAIEHAKAKHTDVVLIDTAGRLHSNTNLMDELKKVVRVAKPDMKLFIGESITGNDVLEQAQTFQQAVGIDGIILSKADVDEKGGAFLSISYVTKKPILYIGTGQNYEDLKPFEKELVMSQLGL